MQRTEMLFEKVAEVLENNGFSELTAPELDIYVELTREFYRIEQKKKRHSRDKASVTASDLSAGSTPVAAAAVCCGGGQEADAPQSMFETITDDAIAVVDRGLGNVRLFLQNNYSYEKLSGPTHIPYKEPETVSQLSGSGVNVTTGDSQPPAKRQRVEGDADAASPVTVPVYSVDSFLYAEDDIEDLVSRGLVSRHFCRSCGSRDVATSDFITHSFSQDQLVYLSCFLFPSLRPGHTSGGTADTSPALRIVDVGSRLGVVQWACYYASAAGLLPSTCTVAGVEMDTAMTNIQRAVLAHVQRTTVDELDDFVNKNPIETRIVESDCFAGEGASTLQSANVLILHNVFEYFYPTEEGHLQCWLQLRKLVQPGTILVVSPSLEETMSSFSPASWAACGVDTDTASSSGGSGTTAHKAAKALAKKWLREFVEPLDVAAMVTAYVSFRYPDEEPDCAGCDDCHGDGHAHTHAEHRDDDEDVAELRETLANIYVYRVR